jgi:type VI secretion system protein ImpE
MEGLDLFRSGKLQEAIEACTQEVQRRPAVPEARDLLGQLLCFAGQWERADKHLEILGTQFPDRGPVVALIRHLLRAAVAREQFYDEGRLPEFLVRPPDYLQAHLQAAICLRQRETAEAARLLAEAAQARPRVGGRCNGLAFRDLRDVDDMTASFLEAFTTTGKYYWLPLERIRRIALYPTETPLDVLWRRCQIEVIDGPSGIVYLPELYAGSGRAEDELLCVGRGTEWQGGDAEPLRGLGHRLLRVDNELWPLVKITALEFDLAAQAGPSSAAAESAG